MGGHGITARRLAAVIALTLAAWAVLAWVGVSQPSPAHRASSIAWADGGGDGSGDGSGTSSPGGGGSGDEISGADQGAGDVSGDGSDQLAPITSGSGGDHSGLDTSS